MNILIINDDGIESPGIEALARAVATLGEIWVVAPRQETLARSHSVTLDQPLRIEQVRDRWFAVSGTPTDCVLVGVFELLSSRPSLVLSGINRGANLADDVHYSGTVAAAMEACLLGIPALAVSLVFDWSDTTVQTHWDTAAILGQRVAQDLLGNGIADLTFLNLNIPNVPLEQVRGLRVCRLGQRRYEPKVEMRTDLLGRRYYWIGAEHQGFHAVDDSDGPWLELGYATLTPLHADMTAYDQFDHIRCWTSTRLI